VIAVQASSADLVMFSQTTLGLRDLRRAGDGSSTKAKVWVTLSLVVMFSALGGALWIFVQELSNQVVWQGVAYGVLAQNVLIFTAGIVFRLCRRHGDNAF